MNERNESAEANEHSAWIQEEPEWEITDAGHVFKSYKSFPVRHTRAEAERVGLLAALTIEERGVATNSEKQDKDRRNCLIHAGEECFRGRALALPFSAQWTFAFTAKRAVSGYLSDSDLKFHSHSVEAAYLVFIRSLQLAKGHWYAYVHSENKEMEEQNAENIENALFEQGKITAQEALCALDCDLHSWDLDKNTAPKDPNGDPISSEGMKRKREHNSMRNKLVYATDYNNDSILTTKYAKEMKHYANATNGPETFEGLKKLFRSIARSSNAKDEQINEAIQQAEENVSGSISNLARFIVYYSDFFKLRSGDFERSVGDKINNARWLVSAYPRMVSCLLHVAEVTGDVLCNEASESFIQMQCDGQGRLRKPRASDVESIPEIGGAFKGAVLQIAQERVEALLSSGGNLGDEKHKLLMQWKQIAEDLDPNAHITNELKAKIQDA